LQYAWGMISAKQNYSDLIFKLLPIPILGILLLLPLIAIAEDVVVEQPEDLPPKPGYIDLKRDYLSDKFVDFASGIDSFFGNDRHFQETNKSVLQLDATQVSQQGGTPTIGLSFKAKFHLPNAQRRLRLLVESNPDRNLPGQTLGQQLQQQQASLFKEVSTPDSYGAALRFGNMEGSPLQISVDGGLKADNGKEFYTYSIHPFARSSASYIYPMNLVQLKLSESVFWFNSTGLGENTLLEVDHHISEKVLFRATSGATFLVNNQNYSYHQDFAIFDTIDNQKSLLYQITANGVSRPAAEITEYVALVLYRRLIHQDWVYLEINPQLHYPKIDNFKLNSELILRLEFMFSK
jgi:hypothetical protein